MLGAARRVRGGRTALQLRAAFAPRHASSAGASGCAGPAEGAARGADDVSVGEGLALVAKGLQKGLVVASVAISLSFVIGTRGAGVALGDRIESGLKDAGASVERGLVQGGASIGDGAAFSSLPSLFSGALAAGTRGVGWLFGGALSQARAEPKAQPAGNGTLAQRGKA